MPAGRPPIYEKAEEIEPKIEEFFDLCKASNERPTVTGLTLHLGFADKTTLYDYRDREEFSHSIKRALTRVEYSLEKKLDGQMVTGIIFALKNMGWKDKHDYEHTGADGKPLMPPVIQLASPEDVKKTSFPSDESEVE